MFWASWQVFSVRQFNIKALYSVLGILSQSTNMKTGLDNLNNSLNGMYMLHGADGIWSSEGMILTFWRFYLGRSVYSECVRPLSWVYFLCMYWHIHVCVYTGAHGRGGQRSMSGVFLYHFSIFYFEPRSLSGPGSHWFRGSGWLVNPKDLPVLIGSLSPKHTDVHHSWRDDFNEHVPHRLIYLTAVLLGP